MLSACRETLQSVQQHPDLAQTIIHGDCWAENAVRTAKNEVMLIDWECSGLGPAVIDLGSLLLHCHFDQTDDADYHLDLRRIAAVVNGYSQWRKPPANELDFLVEAVRFSAAWRVAWIGRLTKEGWNKKLQQALNRWQRWYIISEEIANIAREYFTQY